MYSKEVIEILDILLAHLNACWGTGCMIKQDTHTHKHTHLLKLRHVIWTRMERNLQVCVLHAAPAPPPSLIMAVTESTKKKISWLSVISYGWESSRLTCRLNLPPLCPKPTTPTTTVMNSSKECIKRYFK